ncbi:response regulator [Microbacterium sp. Marseille-Q6965]|uniref:response regulator n=1 Tax=Microbacterium sp. Marseille-Q6965 TaxID=2965072 RepID=UPI0021B6E7EC|nr:response regulator [Microbacterium sp. Marseille-Q6965]
MTDGATRVLIVDDDFRVSGIHRELVDAHPGYRALPPARDAATARRVIAEAAPQLLLIDVYLPDGDGIELGREAGIDRFILSAANDAATVRRAIASGALQFIVKPFPPSALHDRLSAHARFRNLLARDDATLAQADIDRALAAARGGGESVSARDETRRLLLAALSGGEASAAEAAERAGVSRATAQRHLAALASQGAVAVSLRYGSAGRPEHRYRAT